MRARRSESGSAIGLDSFIGWRGYPDLLTLAGEKGFLDLRFDARCPTGVRGSPPILDLIAANEQVVVAVAAKGSEYLAQRQGRLAAAYDQLQLPAGLDPWSALLDAFRAEPAKPRHVDLPALIKHALGLGQTFPDRRIKLLYLFWEPEGAAGHGAFRQHRAELAEIAERVGQSAVTLVYQSFLELWAAWERQGEPEGLREIVARLRARYSVAFAERPAL